MTTPLPSNLQQAMQHAAQLEAGGQFAAAENIYQQILATAPRYHPAYHALATLAYRAGNLALTAELTAKASAIDSKIGVYHRNLCELYRQLGQLDKAISHGQRAVKLEPTIALGHSNLGVVYYDSKQFAQAEASLKRALALDPKSSGALNAMGSVKRELGDLAQAIHFYRSAASADANNVEALNNLGALLVLESQHEEALAVLTRALQLAPGYSDPHCNLGFVLNGMERYAQAFTHFQTALQLRPNYAEAYLGLAKVYQEQNELAQAETAARQGIALAPGKAESHSILAAVLAEAGATQQAAVSFDHALALSPTLHSALLGKGNLCMERGELETAETLFTQALQQETAQRQLSARYYLTQLKKVQADDPNLAALEAATAFDGLPQREQRYLHFALGKSYDDTARYDMAMTHFIQGCAVKRKGLDYDPAARAQIFADIMAIFSADNIRRWSGSSSVNNSDSELPVFVLGMPRSGTTLIEQIIASHPQVFGAGELPDLLQMVNRGGSSPARMQAVDNTQIAAWGAEYVAGLRRRDTTALRITDKMPSNFLALGLIHVMLPKARIIHVRRDPVDTCLSCFTRLFNRGQEYSYDLAELGAYYTGYHRLMQHWRDVLPKNAFMEVDYEDVVADMETQARRLIAFCGLEWDAACLDFHMNKRDVRTASLTQVRQPIYKSSVGRWRKYEAHLAPLLQALGDLVQ